MNSSASQKPQIMKSTSARGNATGRRKNMSSTTCSISWLWLLVALLGCLFALLTLQVGETQAVAINIYKHRYPFYGGYGGYYPFWGGGYGGGYGGINIGGYGR